MKKSFLLTFIIILVLGFSACTSPQTKQAPAAPPLVDVAVNEDIAVPNTPVTPVASDNLLVPAPESQVQINKNMINPNDFADLTKEYSQAKIKTSLGVITVKFYASQSPATVNNFLNLAKLGFYNNTKFHRVISDFMIQGGDPLSKEKDASVYGTGGPGYRFADEFNQQPLIAGSLAMANSGPNTNGSQFFIVTAASTPWLDGKHTNFGEVTGGLDIVKKIDAVDVNAGDQPINPVIIESIELLK